MTPAPADVLLADGSVAVLRAMLPEDRAGLEDLHAKASDQSVRMRFFTASRTAGSDYVAHLFAGAEELPLSLVAVRDGRIVASATAERTSATRAEVAFLVSDTAHGRGLGTLLLEHLAAAGHELGITDFTAEVLGENHAMLGVFREAGFASRLHRESGVITVAMSTASSARSRSAADDRESSAEAASLRPLLGPRTVAVGGVRRDGTGTGAAVLGSIGQGGFTGTTYAVHPTASDLGGVPTFPSLVDVPEHVDLVVLTVPAAGVLDAMHDAVAAGVSAVVVVTSGFAELGAEGAALQQRLQRLARDHSIRLVGPNCLGVMANDPAIRLNATFTTVTPPDGGLAIASQSGGVGIALLDLACQVDLGVHAFVSLGNKADVSGNDLLAAWSADPSVTAVALYLESFGNALKFARVAARFAERKPLLAVVGGRSAGGRRAGASHTAAAATPAVGVDALFDQCGVIACHDVHDQVHTARLLADQPLPRGPRLGIVSNAGGLGVLAADSADRVGLVVPELSAGLREQIGVGVTGTVGLSNPVDLGAGVTPEDFRAAVAPLVASDEVDAVVVLLVATVMAEPGALVEALATIRARVPDKPVLLVTYGDLRPAGGRDGLTVYDSAQTALTSLSHAARYAEWLRTPRGESDDAVDPGRATTARLTAHELVEDGHGWVGPADVGTLLAPYGLAPVGREASNIADTVNAADATGYPVAVKVADPEIVHKSDRGLVRVGLRSAREVCDVVDDFRRALGVVDVAVLVQPVLDGVEVALGLVRDASFGPMVMVAAGGVDIDVWDDRVFLLPPVTARDATCAVHALRIRPLLEGHRGRPVADVAGLERAIVALGQVAVDVPEIAELDLNPVLVGTDRVSIVDAKLRLSTAPLEDTGVPRRLRTTS